MHFGKLEDVARSTLFLTRMRHIWGKFHNQKMKIFKCLEFFARLNLTMRSNLIEFDKVLLPFEITCLNWSKETYNLVRRRTLARPIETRLNFEYNSMKINGRSEFAGIYVRLCIHISLYTSDAIKCSNRKLYDMKSLIDTLKKVIDFDYVTFRRKFYAHHE